MTAGRQGDRANEEALYRATLLLDEKHGPAAFNLAATLQQRGEIEEALTWVGRAEELLPGDPRPPKLRRVLIWGPVR